MIAAGITRTIWGMEHETEKNKDEEGKPPTPFQTSSDFLCTLPPLILKIGNMSVSSKDIDTLRQRCLDGGVIMCSSSKRCKVKNT